MRKIILSTAVPLSLIVGAPALAEVTASVGFDYATGKYGTPDSTDTWTFPLQGKYESGPTILKLTVPFVRSTGTVNRDTGVAVVSGRRTDEGLGDVVASAAYNVLDGRGSSLGLDLGVKAKFATADKDKTLITTGKNDYSAQADLFKSFGAVTGFATLGATKKGDPAGIDFKDPWYATLGASYKLSTTLSAGALYDYRSKLLNSSPNLSQLTFFVTNALSKQWKLQAYVVNGLSDAAPDWAVGGLLSYIY